MSQYLPCPVSIGQDRRFELEVWIAYLLYRHNHSGERFLASRIDNGKLGAKVIEHGAVQGVLAPGKEGGPGGCIPKQTTGFRGNEVNTVGVRPLIDLELFAEGNAREDNNLRGLRQSRAIRPVGERRAWKPLIRSGEISCPAALGRTRTGT